MKNQSLVTSTTIETATPNVTVKPRLFTRLRATPGTLKRGLIRLNIKQEITNLLFLTVGTLIAAFSYALFQVPYNIAAGGLGGLSIIINHFTGLPVGTLYLIMNVPLLILGFFYLGRWIFVIRTMLA